mmetsp:Transcript_1144/g.4522  ORF Transcript_1144/g.4522 Transcript_1144/m.4522 type:complete len:228 (-) Transcript_1144:752-1435(-)
MFAAFGSPCMSVFIPGAPLPVLPKGWLSAPTCGATACSLAPSVPTSTPSSMGDCAKASAKLRACSGQCLATSSVSCSAGCMEGCQYAPEGHTAAVSSSHAAAPSPPPSASAQNLEPSQKNACSLASPARAARACAALHSQCWLQPSSRRNSSRRRPNLLSSGSAAHGRRSTAYARATGTPAFTSASHAADPRNVASTAYERVSRASLSGAVRALRRACSSSDMAMRL